MESKKLEVGAPVSDVGLFFDYLEELGFKVGVTPSYVSAIEDIPKEFQAIKGSTKIRYTEGDLYVDENITGYILELEPGTGGPLYSVRHLLDTELA